VVNVWLEADGAPRAAKILSNDGGADSEMEECVLSVFAHKSFVETPPADGCAEVNVPIRFLAKPQPGEEPK
jgi:hypothetical protein